jgi:hypothetical protein
VAENIFLFFRAGGSDGAATVDSIIRKGNSSDCGTAEEAAAKIFSRMQFLTALYR